MKQGPQTYYEHKMELNINNNIYATLPIIFVLLYFKIILKNKIIPA